MHDVLRARLLRKIETLPEEQVYQVLDFIEFLEAKYSKTLKQEASGLQRFAEGLEDKMRKKALSPATLREAFQLISAADKALSGVSKAGKQILAELNGVVDPPSSGDPQPQKSVPPRSGTSDTDTEPA